MTDRRSFQTWTERMSRQTQFVPGHVGGRVASAQPVKRRATVGQVQPMPMSAIPPTYVQDDVRNLQGRLTTELNDEFYSPAGGADWVTVWAFSDTYALTPPSGWTTLASGSYSSQYYWAGWRDGDLATGDWTLDRAATGTNSHYVAQWWNGGTMTPAITSITTAASVSTFALPSYGSWLVPSQVAWVTVPANRYFTVDEDAGAGAFDDIFYGGPQSTDWWTSDNGSSAYSTVFPGAWTINTFSDSGRTTPASVTSVIAFAIGWA